MYRCLQLPVLNRVVLLTSRHAVKTQCPFSYGRTVFSEHVSSMVYVNDLHFKQRMNEDLSKETLSAMNYKQSSIKVPIGVSHRNGLTLRSDAIWSCVFALDAKVRFLEAAIPRFTFQKINLCLNSVTLIN